MQTASGLPIRKSPRLKDHPYGGEATYFITVCADEWRCIFGSCIDAAIHLSPEGETVNRQWLRTRELRPDAAFDVFQVMPNHFHALLRLAHGGRQDVRRIVGGFKSAVTSEIRHRRGDQQFVVWQRSFHDHIIRSMIEYEKIRDYILNNPAAWEMDRYHR
jgi:REP element-mobilizing transposase RayT